MEMQQELTINDFSTEEGNETDWLNILDNFVENGHIQTQCCDFSFSLESQEGLSQYSTPHSSQLSESTNSKRRSWDSLEEQDPTKIRKLTKSMNESKRRQKINELLNELKELTDCEKVDRATILETTVNALSELRNRVERLSERKGALMQQVQTADPPEDSLAKQTPFAPQIRKVDYLLAFQASTPAMAISKIDGRFIDCNEFFCILMEYPKSIIGTATMMSLTKPEELGKTFEVISSLLSGDYSFIEMKKQCVCRSGKIVSAKVRIAVIRDKLNNPLYFHCCSLPCITKP